MKPVQKTVSPTLRGVVAVLLGASMLAAGCVTPADHRKLKYKVAEIQRGGGGRATGVGVADLAAEIESLRSEVKGLRGRVEVAERKADEALAQARKAREAGAGRGADAATPLVPEAKASREVQRYREAYASWRAEDLDTCIDRFRGFLQTYASSPYADDAAYWMADCYFKKRDYRTAVLRFDDVVRQYPQGNRAPDALYRQGESLLKLGTGFREAATRAFERVLNEYPDAARAPEAKRQIEIIKAG